MLEDKAALNTYNLEETSLEEAHVCLRMEMNNHNSTLLGIYDSSVVRREAYIFVLPKI